MIQTIVSWISAILRFFGRIFEWFLGMLKDIMEFFADLPVLIFEGILDGVIYLLSAIPVPEFMASGSQGALQVAFNALHPDVQYLVNFFGIHLGLAVIGAGVLFRLTRKAATLGQW